MRMLMFAGLFALLTSAAAAQITPHPPSHPTTVPPPTTIPLRCADLTIAGFNRVAGIPGAPPLAANERVYEFDVKNIGLTAYNAPSSSTQWIAIEFVTPTGVVPGVGMAVLPHAATGAVSLAIGATWHGYIRMSIPASIHAPYPPARMAIRFAGSTTGLDCNHGNDTVPLTFS